MRRRSGWLWLVAVAGACRLAAAQSARPLAVDPAATDALVAKVIAPVKEDAELAAVGAAIVAYAPKADGATLTFKLVDTPRPVTVALPNGSIYLSQGVLDRVGRHPDRLAFLCAAEANLVLDGRTQADDIVKERMADPARLPDDLITTCEHTLTAQRMREADLTAMLYLARDGITPMAAVSALEALAGSGRTDLCWTADLPDVASLEERRASGTQGAVKLLQSARMFDLGVDDLSRGNYEQAAAEFSQFLMVLRNNYAGWNNLGLCWYHVATLGAGPGDYLLADAVAQWDSRFGIKSTLPFLNRPAWDKALRSYQIAQTLAAGRLEVLNNLGNLYCVDEQWEPAEQCYQAALQADPKYALALNNCGAMQARRGGPAGDLKPAQALFEQAVQIDPLLPEARYNLGEVQRTGGGERDRWVENFRRYVSLAPNAPSAFKVADLIGGNGGGADPAAPAATMVAERELSLANRARLALGTQERRLVATLAGAPDERQEGTLADTELCVWNRLGISVEMRRGSVSRVLAGRPPGLEASTLRGVRVGDERKKVETEYGRGRSTSRNDPYLIWMYADVGVGFFLVENRVNKIVLFSVEGEG